MTCENSRKRNTKSRRSAFPLLENNLLKSVTCAKASSSPANVQDLRTNDPLFQKKRKEKSCIKAFSESDLFPVLLNSTGTER